MKDHFDWENQERERENRMYEIYEKFKFLHSGKFEEVLKEKLESAKRVNLVSSDDSIYIFEDSKKTDLLEGVKIIRKMNEDALPLISEMIPLPLGSRASNNSWIRGNP